MSRQIETARAIAFSETVFHLSQQRGSRIKGTVRNEMCEGAKTKRFDRVGLSEFTENTDPTGDTQYTEVPHSRRSVSGRVYDKATLISPEDLLRMKWGPENEYVRSYVDGAGRKMDDIIIDAASGTATTGEEGGSTASLANGNKLASVASSAGSRLNVEALRRAQKYFDEDEVDEMDRSFLYNANQRENLLSETEVTSADFNTIRTLVRGKMNSFLGFEFIRTERLNTQSGTLAFNTSTGAVGSGGGDADTYTKCLAYQRRGIIFAIWNGLETTIDRMPNKRNARQIFSKFYAGSVRMEENSVLEVLCATS